MSVTFGLRPFWVLFIQAMACVMASIIFFRSNCICAAFKFLISFFCHSITSVWSLIFSLFVFPVELVSWLYWLVSFTCIIFNCIGGHSSLCCLSQPGPIYRYTFCPKLCECCVRWCHLQQIVGHSCKILVSQPMGKLGFQCLIHLGPPFGAGIDDLSGQNLPFIHKLILSFFWLLASHIKITEERTESFS